MMDEDAQMRAAHAPLPVGFLEAWETRNVASVISLFFWGPEEIPGLGKKYREGRNTSQRG